MSNETVSDESCNWWLGLACGVAIIFIWSGFMVFSRQGVSGAMTPFDITALRFMVVGVLITPFAYVWWPRHIPILPQIMLSIAGPSVLYSTIMFFGLSQASAAYGGVFSNGALPLFGLLVAFLAARQIPSKHQMVAIPLVLFGGILLAFRGMQTGGSHVVLGIAFFLLASGIMSIYIYGVQHWKLKPKEALALISVPNAILYLPIWYFLLPSGLAEEDWSNIIFQAAFQGLGPGFLAVILFALAIKHLGPMPVSLLSASVPAFAALMAVPVLSEKLTAVEWAGVIIVTLGLYISCGVRFPWQSRC